MKEPTDRFSYRFDPKRNDILYLTVDRRGYIPGVGGDLLSWDIRSETEIDEHVESLCRQLKAAGKNAKMALKRRTGG